MVNSIVPASLVLFKMWFTQDLMTVYLCRSPLIFISKYDANIWKSS